METRTFLKIRYLSILSLAAFTALLQACSGGSGSVSSSGSSSTSSMAITLSAINGSTATSTGSTTVTAAATSLTGACTRGVSSGKVSIDGTTQTTGGTCSATGVFTYTTSYADGTHTVIVTPANKAGVEISGSAGFTKTLVVDTVAPAKPAITGSSMLTPTAAVTAGTSSTATALDPAISITGTCDTDVDAIKVYLGGVYVTSLTQDSTGSGTWTYNYTIPAGGSYSLSFKAFDLAGNTASGAATTLAVTYNSSVTLAGQSFDQSFKTGTDSTITYSAIMGNGNQLNATTTPATGVPFWFQYGLSGIAE